MRSKTIGYGLLILAMSWLTACLSGITIGGKVSGLTGTGLVLRYDAYLSDFDGGSTLAGSDTLNIVANGNFTFSTPLPVMYTVYSVHIESQPSGQVCLIDNKGSNRPTASVTDISVQCAANAEFNLLAGSLTLAGSNDGTGAAARFAHPNGIATDGAGNAYVADTDNNTIRKISPAGLVTSLVGMVNSPGNVDGTGAAARFANPSAIATDSAGNVYVTDNDTIRKITPGGVVTTLAGMAGASGFADGAGSNARFGDLAGISTDGAGYVYVTDSLYKTIRKISPAGVVTTLAGSVGGVVRSTDGTGAAAGFANPVGIAMDSAGNAYVADYTTIRKITPAGVVTTLAGAPTLSYYIADGTGADAQFSESTLGIAVDGAGNVYVTDGANSYVRKISPLGLVTTVATVPSGVGLGIAISADKLLITSGLSVLWAAKP